MDTHTPHGLIYVCVCAAVLSLSPSQSVCLSVCLFASVCFCLWCLQLAQSQITFFPAKAYIGRLPDEKAQLDDCEAYIYDYSISKTDCPDEVSLLGRQVGWQWRKTETA